MLVPEALLFVTKPVTDLFKHHALDTGHEIKLGTEVAFAGKGDRRAAEGGLHISKCLQGIDKIFSRKVSARPFRRAFDYSIKSVIRLIAIPRNSAIK